ncbi:MAG: hypothetical protein KAY22_12530 [Rhizorhabdus sp.]|uniref:HIRAN domain-containing protein n=1 Tax=Rhizorhabdus sp. TaxID=1968843 RepID=UPI001B7299FB|nr:HIRAN domain-containing protein [Rhizorhabdus sp.]MBP8233125.1 hypothetical protein [Rhizorhabdus sp.]
MTIPIVGVNFPNTDKAKTNRRFELMLCAPGDPVELRLEPKNPFDKRAVAIFSTRGIQIGYVQAERAAFIGGLIRRFGEVQAIFQAATDHGGLIRVGLEGQKPELPPATSTPHHRKNTHGDSGFYPDEIWPDD